MVTQRLDALRWSCGRINPDADATVFLSAASCIVNANLKTAYSGKLLAQLNTHREPPLTLACSLFTFYRGAGKSLARPTSQCILFDGENISFDASFVIYVNSINIPPIMIINRIYEHQNLLSL